MNNENTLNIPRLLVNLIISEEQASGRYTEGLVPTRSPTQPAITTSTLHLKSEKYRFKTLGLTL